MKRFSLSSKFYFQQPKLSEVENFELEEYQLLVDKLEKIKMIYQKNNNINKDKLIHSFLKST